MSPARIGLIGYNGRMGQAIACAIAQNEHAMLVGGVVHTKKDQAPSGLILTEDLNELAPTCDVLIDFSAPSSSAKVAQIAMDLKKPLVCGTTGLDQAGKDALQKAASAIPLIHASNTSLSLVVMKQLVQLASKLLRDQDYDISILDQHHRMKKDAPSGTAKTLGEFVLAGNGHVKEPSYSAIRAGYIVGEHDVIFAGNGEVITLKHSVTDRNVFARGAVQAALWLKDQKPGAYTMNDVLGIQH